MDIGFGVVIGIGSCRLDELDHAPRLLPNVVWLLILLAALASLMSATIA